VIPFAGGASSVSTEPPTGIDFVVSDEEQVSLSQPGTVMVTSAVDLEISAGDPVRIGVSACAYDRGAQRVVLFHSSMGQFVEVESQRRSYAVVGLGYLDPGSYLLGLCFENAFEPVTIDERINFGGWAEIRE